MSNLSRHPSVKWDLVEIYDYIAKDNPPAAERVLDAFEEALELINSVPLAGVKYRSSVPALSEVRMLPVKGFESYLIFYLPKEEMETRILYVCHGARDIPALMETDERR